MSWVATAVVVGTSLVSAGVSYYGAQQQAKAQEKAANYNALNARHRAQEERDTASENARRKRKDNQRRIASMRARASSGGLAFDGSLLDSIAESSSVLERETGDIFRQGLARGQQHEAQANMTLFEGGLMAGATRSAANANLLSDLAGTAGNGYTTYKGV